MSVPTPLTEAFQAAHARPVVREVEDALGAWLVRARAAWPVLAIDDSTAIAYIAERWPGTVDVDMTAVAATPAEDLYLACGCAEGDAAALAGFVERFGPQVRAVVRRLGLHAASVDDVVQLVMDRLLVGRGTELPRIHHYAGRSELAAFVRVVAVRVAVSLQRTTPRGLVDDRVLAELDSGHDDPELAYLKQLYQAEFRAAFAAAVADLSPRDRALLRYQIVEGLSIDQIAAIYGRPRSTVGRHLLEARDNLHVATRAHLRAALRIDHREMSSVLRLVQSSLDVSVRRLLGPSPVATGEES